MDLPIGRRTDKEEHHHQGSHVGNAAVGLIVM